MVSWGSGTAGGVDNSLSGYGRAEGSGVFTPRAVYSTIMYYLRNPGTVDLNAVTRMQYYIEFYSLMYARSTLIYSAADVADNPGLRLSGTHYIAPASAFAPGAIPTPAEIRAAATMLSRGYNLVGGNAYLTAPGTISLGYYANDGLTWAPNEKWWLLVAPTTHVAGSVNPATDTPVGDINVNGRAVSFWTNRTPDAPLITQPVGRTAALAGTTLTFAFTTQDPDRIASFPGDNAPQEFADLAGLQIQYAPQPTEADPTPTWEDLPVVNASGTAVGSGWYIFEAASPDANDGLVDFWKTGKLKIRCGLTASQPSTAYLPAGKWQIRMRTFDFGHGITDIEDLNPFLPSVPPLTDWTYSYTPDNYPEDNASDWSEPALVSVSEQVPSPVPISPINNIAVIEGSDVTLNWQYRNTYVPPFGQATRTVQIREVGAGGWTTLVGEDVSASTSLLVEDFEMVSGNQYQWRIRVKDTGGVTSAWSEIVNFWIVPLPASGSVIPDPGESLDGATLGCGTHRVLIYRRGGTRYVGEIKNISKVEWNRVRDDMSDAVITVSGWDIDCGNLLSQLQSWAYEVVIFRDNGFSVDRVWEGPITLLTYETTTVTINAKDVMAYAYRRIIKQEFRDSGKSLTAGRTVVERAAAVLQNVFAPDDPNVLAYLQLIVRDDDAKQYRSLPAYSRTGYEEVDDMAANAGLDYTAVGRAILLWGTKHRIGTLPEFRDKDLGNSPIVSEYGMSMANVYAVSDGNGVWGEANLLDENGRDETYGLVEVLSSTWASDSASEEGTYTEEGINEVSESFASAAERSIADKYPPPLVVRVPDNTRLNPDTVISIRHLVPGVIIPLVSTSTLRKVRASQKLDKVKVVEEKGSEAITVTLSPFSRDDQDAVVEVG